MTNKPSRAQRATNGLLVLIVLAVGTMAGAASFRHVHDWTMHNSPAGTSDWFGWANAVITELIPTAALIIIARRRKNGGHIGYPMFLLVVAVSLSLTAQLAVALPTVFGWMVSALPSLAFFALSKLVFSATKDTDPTGTTPAAAPASDGSDASPARVALVESRPPAPAPAQTHADRAPAPSPDTALGTLSSAPPEPSAPTIPTATMAADAPGPQPARQPQPAPEPASTAPAAGQDKPGSTLADLLPSARLFAQAHHQAHGAPITPNQLAVRLRVDTTTAERLLNTITTAPAGIPAHHNGTVPAITRPAA